MKENEQHHYLRIMFNVYENEEKKSNKNMQQVLHMLYIFRNPII